MSSGVYVHSKVAACLALDFFVVGTPRARAAVLAASMVLENFMVKGKTYSPGI